MKMIPAFSDEEDFIAEVRVSNDAYSICYRQSSVRFMTLVRTMMKIKETFKKATL